MNQRWSTPLLSINRNVCLKIKMFSQNQYFKSQSLGMRFKGDYTKNSDLCPPMCCVNSQQWFLSASQTQSRHIYTMSAPDTDRDSTCQGLLYVGASYLLQYTLETLYLYCSFMLGTCRAVKPLLGPTMNRTQRMWLRKWAPWGNQRITEGSRAVVQNFKNKHIGNNLLFVTWNNLDALITSNPENRNDVNGFILLL